VWRAGDERLVLRVDFLLSGEPCWASNDLRFLDEGEALAFAGGVCERWNLIDEIRVVPEDQPRQETYLTGSEYRSAVSGGDAGSRVGAG
jgi:hypothetical protein